MFTNQRFLDTRMPMGAPLLVDTVFGLNYRTGQGTAEELSPHVDNFLAEFGELGIPLSQPLTTRNSRKTLANCLDDSMLRARATRECEWSLIAFASYLSRQNSWRNHLGEQITLGQLTEFLVEKQPGNGPCFGTHREYALARVVSRARKATGFIPAASVSHVERALREASGLLARTQTSAGSWRSQWFRSQDIPTTSGKQFDFLEETAVTGHVLEWISICPRDLRPNDDVVVRAASYLLGILLSRREVFELDYVNATHAVRALLQLGDRM